MLAAGRRRDLTPEVSARKCHLRERVVRRAPRLHADEHAATRSGRFVRIQEDAFWKHEIDWCQRGAANAQGVKQIFGEEIGDVSYDGLRMDVVGRWIFRRSSVEIENDPFALLR